MKRDEYLALVGEWLALKVSLENKPTYADLNHPCGKHFEVETAGVFRGGAFRVLYKAPCMYGDLCPACQEKRNAVRQANEAIDNDRRRKVDRANRLWKKVAAGYAEHADAFKVSP